jgi:hypothetical protein
MVGVNKMLVTFKKSIKKCYHECPHFELDGGPGPVMTCSHPDAPNSGYIISHPDCDNGFPKKCPVMYPKTSTKKKD